jgi:two-component system NtrC family sensor kinase
MQLKFYNKLSFKLILVISLILLLNLVFYVFFTLNNLEGDLFKAISQNAYNLSDVIKKSTRYSMLLNRTYDVHQIINTIGTEQGVEKVRIYNKQGQIVFSTDSTELHKKVNMNTEACIVCHVNGNITSHLPVKDRIRIFRNTAGAKVIGLINPIENEKDCYTSECHAHSSDVEVLGILDVVLSAEKTEVIIRNNTKSIITNSLIVTVIIAGFSWFFIGYVFNRPVRKITKGIKELGKGNLNYKIDIDSKDELGEMAIQFNEMSAKLDAAYKEIKQWNDTLNVKVNEKTEELKKIYKQVIQIEKLASLGKLSATVAHELNNPLEGILTYSRLIIKKLGKEQKENEYSKILEFLSLIAEESARCGRIVKDLLLFSHRDEDQFCTEDMHSIVEKCELLINHHLEINKIKLLKEFPDQQINVYGDGQKIQQALISLLINAIEAMPEGGCIRVKSGFEGENVIIRVIDEGHGISEKDLPHIFEPFYSTKQKSKGTGLGLSVVYGIVEQHKGKIEVEDTSPSGTTFKISLPSKK